MAIDAGLLDLMVEEITIEPYAGIDVWGTKSYGAPVTFKARIESANKKVFSSSRTDPSSVERVATGRIFIRETPVVSEDDRLTLPNGQRPQILSVEYSGDERGPHHQILWT